MKTKKSRLYVVVALLAAPSIMMSSPGLSTSDLPEIDTTTKPFQQSNCPVEQRYGCFNSSQPSPFAFCRQFMQVFLRPGAG